MGKSKFENEEVEGERRFSEGQDREIRISNTAKAYASNKRDGNTEFKAKFEIASLRCSQ